MGHLDMVFGIYVVCLLGIILSVLVLGIYPGFYSTISR